MTMAQARLFAILAGLLLGIILVTGVAAIVSGTLPSPLAQPAAPSLQSR
jgi:hypothetical protein